MSDIAEEVLIRSSGNVFADLDLPHPSELAIKSTLLSAIQDAFAREPRAPAHLSLSADDETAVARGDHDRWTIDDLIALLASLGMEVTVRVLDATGSPVRERAIAAPSARHRVVTER